MELKKNVSSPHDVYQELNDQVEKNSTLNRRCEISQAEKEDLLGRVRDHCNQKLQLSDGSSYFFKKNFLLKGTCIWRRLWLG